jgi:hypothetical protein
MTRFLAVQILCLALACSSGGGNNDAAGSAGASAGSGGGGAAGTTGGAGTTGTGGNAGTTGSAGRGGGSGSGGSTGAGGTGGIKCLAFDSPGLVRGLACPSTTPPCYANCDFDGDQYVGCISGSTDFTECYPSCGACP